MPSYSLCDKKEKKINCYKIIKDDMQNNPYIGELKGYVSSTYNTKNH